MSEGPKAAQCTTACVTRAARVRPMLTALTCECLRPRRPSAGSAETNSITGSQSQALAAIMAQLHSGAVHLPPASQILAAYHPYQPRLPRLPASCPCRRTASSIGRHKCNAESQLLCLRVAAMRGPCAGTGVRARRHCAVRMTHETLRVLCICPQNPVPTNLVA